MVGLDGECLAAVLSFISCLCMCRALFFFNDPATTEIYTLSLHDAHPISARSGVVDHVAVLRLRRQLGLPHAKALDVRSEEHTSELQSPYDLVCRLLLEKTKKKTNQTLQTTTKSNHTTHLIKR